MLPEALEGKSAPEASLWRSPGPPPCCICKAQEAFVGLVQGAAHACGQANFPATTCDSNSCRAQKTSLWGWALGSVCTVVTECYEVVTLSNIQKQEESDEALRRRALQASSLSSWLWMLLRVTTS